MKKTWLALVTVLLIGLTPATQAQWAVFDAPNFSQSLLTAAHTLQQIDNQIVQLQNEAQMLMNESKNLKNLNFNSLSQIINLLNTTGRLIQQAQGMAFNAAQVNSQFNRLYPQSYPLGTPTSQMAMDAQTRWSYSLYSQQTAMGLQAQAVQNFPSDQATLSSLVNQSQSAVGALQAQQATNQLLALQARQQIQEQQLRITQDRATALEQARETAAQSQAVTVRLNFVGTGPQYTPQSVNFYNY